MFLVRNPTLSFLASWGAMPLFAVLSASNMYSCATCARAFASRSTLSRHERNHLQQPGFSCTTCHVRFQRRDLLKRHRLIHDRNQRSQSERQRCHTACDSCKARRIKCDGSTGASKCANCLRSDLICKYESKSSRTSATTSQTSRTLDQVDSTTEADHSILDTSLSDLGASTSHAITATVNTLYVNSLPDPTSSSPTGQMDANDSPIHEVENGLDIAFDAPFDTFWPFSTSWQWAHEYMYLQNTDLYDSLSSEERAINPTLTYSSSNNVQASGLCNHSVPNPPGSSQRLTTRESHSDGLCEVTERTQLDLHGVVSEMTLQAAKYTHGGQWPVWSSQLSRLVEPSNAEQNTVPPETFLDRLVDGYFTHFHPLWPFIPMQSVPLEKWHPLLYLTLSSIGALYSGPNVAARYGSLMHAKLRTTLLEYKIRSEQPESEVLDIGRAMLLNQVAALYFEQEGAFSASEQLGARLNAHAHRMRLFTQRNSKRALQTDRSAETHAVTTEGRKLLAYGILRAETYMSVVFNRKPMLSYEELNLKLPRAHDATMSLSETDDYPSRRLSGTPCGGLLFSDLVRIALDTEEALPLLRPVDLELLMFGLQTDVWRFCHDPEIFSRLIHQSVPQSRSEIGLDKGKASLHPSADLLDQTERKMSRLTSEYECLHHALDRWSTAMSQSQLVYPVAESRSPYLSGLVLLKLSRLRLSAPVDTVLQMAHNSHDLLTVDSAIGDHLASWLSSPHSIEAISHSREIWQLLNAETSRSDNNEAKYNILALIALHIAAAVTWIVAGSNSRSDVCFLQHQHAPDLMLRQSNTQSIMRKFGDLYPKITISWGMQSSFARIVQKLAEHPFTML